MRSALRSRLLWLGALPLTAWGGCVPCCGGPTELVTPDAWVLVDEADDPFEPTDTGATITRCDESAVMEEDLDGRQTWTVDTSRCNWATVRQPLLAPLAAGDPVRVEVFYFSQVSFIGGLAEVKLTVDGDELLNAQVEIPTEGSLLDETVAVDRDIPAGAPVHFHIGNHGANTWNLLGVTAPVADGCPVAVD